jgi:hypothetical protein
MPNFFSLTRKTDKEAGPVSLRQIDDEIRKHSKNLPTLSIGYGVGTIQLA